MPNQKPPNELPSKAKSLKSKSADVVPINKAADPSNAAAVASGPVAQKRASRTAKPQPAPEAKVAPKAPAVAKSGSTLRLKDLTERVETLTGAKKKAVRQTVDAVLTVLGHALMAGDDLNLPPLGRARVSRQRDREDGEILMIRLKRHADDPTKSDKAAARKAEKEALAATPEES